jgi:hypothetical protein
MMKRWIVNEYMSKNSSLEFDMIGYGDQRRAFLASVYSQHTLNVREFVKTFPSHSLIEVNMTDPRAGELMGASFGLSSSCWGHKNKQEEHEKIANKVVGLLTQGKFSDDAPGSGFEKPLSHSDTGRSAVVP